MTILLRLAMLLLLVFPVQALTADAAQESPLEVAQRLQKSFDSMHSLSFNFYQDTRGEMTGRPKKGSGKAVFLRTGKASRMRWDYLNPDRQIIINDGTTVSMYFEELNQMIVSPAENLDKDLTYAFFTGRGNVERDFYIRPAEEQEMAIRTDDFSVIKLMPKTMQSQVKDIHVWVTPNSLIRRLKIRDHFGTITVLSFSDIKVDALKSVSEKEQNKIFTFEPPSGTEIIRQ